jgi:hypothetical protein
LRARCRTSKLVASIGLAASLWSAGAFAEDTDSAASESLFRDGKRLLELKDFARACPKLAESFRLDPATGTLLALALCHEGEGKIATAWAEYVDAAARARGEGRPDRAEAARAWAGALEPKLPRLTIVVPDVVARTADLRVKRNGIALGLGAWGMAVPVDPGEHVVEVTASGKKPWVRTVSIRAESYQAEVTVPVLDDRDIESAPRPEEARRGLSSVQQLGLMTGGMGVLMLGAGTFFGLRALHKNDLSKEGCDGNVCDPYAKQMRLDARTAGNVATGGFMAGTALLIGGAVMYFAGADRAPKRAGMRAAPAVGDRNFALVLEGAF